MTSVSWSESQYLAMVELLSVRTGLSFRANQREMVEAGIRRAMHRAGVKTLADYATRLRQSEDTFDDLVVELTVGETYFFREPGQFAFIRNNVLPEIRRRRGDNHMIRMWSAGCASGEEAYSLAMLVDRTEYARSSSILATDISSAALAKAREATYREWSLRGEGAKAAKPYLHFDKTHYQLDPKICRRVQFGCLNLAADVYPSHVTNTREMDLILCRNVLIYFSRDTIRVVARRFYDALAEGGWLMLGSGDPPIDQYAPFEITVTNAGVFYRKTVVALSGALVNPPAQGLGEAKTAAPKWDAVDTFGSYGGTAQSEVAGVTRDGLRQADLAPANGDNQWAGDLTHDRFTDLATCVLHLKALANVDLEHAVQTCIQAVERHPLSPELHYLHAALLLEANRDAEGVEAARRTVYLDRSLAVAHYLLGSILQRDGKLDGARRAFRNARQLCAGRPADEVLPLTENETAGQLARAADIQLAAIDAACGRTS